MEKQRVVFIPGFMDVAANYSDAFAGLDIWKENADWTKRIDADVVVEYSLGANFALLNWEKNQNTKLVLVNPLVPKRSRAAWAKRWLSFFKAEGLAMNGKRSKIMVHFPLKTLLASRLLSENLNAMLDAIPKGTVAVVRGRRDDFFCDVEATTFIENRGITLHEVDAGHTWNKNIEKEVEVLIKQFLRA